METVVLQASVRDQFGKKLAQYRQGGKLPAILYGNKKDNQPLELDARNFDKVFHQVGQSTIIELKVGDKVENVLIHELSHDPLTGNIAHVDFLRVDMNKTIRTEVPLHFVGESQAVFQDEGTLFKNIEEVELETLPATLPANIEIDISGLDDFTKVIHVSDIPAIEGVTILADPEQLICKVEPPRSEEELAALEEEVGDAIPEGAAEEGEAAEGEGEAAEGEATEGEAAEGGEAEKPKPADEKA